MTSSTDDKAILDDVLDRWKAGVDTHQPERVAALFTEDALFPGLHPYSVGRRGVAEYHDSQPAGLPPRPGPAAGVKRSCGTA